MATARPWWRDFFDGSFVRLWAPFMDADRTAIEVDGLAELLADLEGGADLLDLCGGHGRIAHPMAALGHRVVIVDGSRWLLAHGAATGDVALPRICADARNAVFHARFDVVLNLFTSFGLFATDGEHVNMLRAAAQALKPGGRLILDLIHRDSVAPLAPERTWYRLEDGARVLRYFGFDPVSGRTEESLEELGLAAGSAKHWSLRVFTATEIDRMLRAAGLVPQAWYDGLGLGAFTSRSSRLVAVAVKPGGARSRPTVAARPLEAPAARQPEESEPMTMQTTSWRDIVGWLRCPETGQPLALADPVQVEAINAAVARGEALRADGELVSQVVEAALVRADGCVAYPVRGDIPELFVGEGIVLPERTAD